MARSTLTKYIEFSASHRFGRDDWDEARNQNIFGPCYREHGHNYLLDVTLGGQVDPTTGMIINLYDLKRVVSDVLEEFDHKHLNFDTPYFDQLVPTTENLALVLWRKFRARPETRNIATIRLREGDDLWAELHTPTTTAPASMDNAEPVAARVTRRYALPIHHNAPSSPMAAWPVFLDVTVHGPIDPVTGRVANIMAMDEQITPRRLADLHDTHLSQHPQPASRPGALSLLAKALWPPLNNVTEGRLAQLRLQDPCDLTLEYSEAPHEHGHPV